MDVSINKILLPIDFPNFAPRVIAQAVYLARHFQSEIILLHVLSAWSYPDGVLEEGTELKEQGLWTEAVKQAQRDLDQVLQPEPEGITVRRMLCTGHPAREISRTARDEHVDLIMMSTHHHGVLYRLLLGSVTAKVLHDSDCLVWTDTHLEAPPTRAFGIRNVLCAVDLRPHSQHTVSGALHIAAAFDARLTLVHVTAGVESFGPGGNHLVPEWKELLVGEATKEIAKLQKALGTEADVIIESGHLHSSLNAAAAQSKADLMVIGHLPSGGHLGENGSGYSIIRASHVSVLSL